MTDLRTAAQQALEALETVFMPFYPAVIALKAALAEPTLQICNCRWDGEVQVQQCALHEAHVDAIHEWAERAKTAEKKLAAITEPVQEPVAWRFQSAVGGWAYGSQPPLGSKYPVYPLYTAPPQRKPLTEEEIRDLWSWAMTAEAERTATTQQHAFARAIERAHGIKE